MDPFETKLTLAPHLRFVASADGSAYLLESGRSFRVKEPLHIALLEAADGSRTGERLMLELDGRFDGAEVLYALRRLHDRGILVQVGAAPSPHVAAFWAPEGFERGGLVRLREAPIGLVAGPGVEGGRVLEALHRAGLERAALAHDVDASTPPSGALALCVSTDYAGPGWAERLSAWRARGVAVLCARLEGQAAWLGPLLDADSRAPCPRCLGEAIARNRPLWRHLAREGREDAAPPLGHLPASIDAAASFVALRLADALVKGELGSLRQRLLALDLRRFALGEHAVVRRPQCPGCGDAEWMARQIERPIVLTERESSHGDDGGYRSVSPEETYARYRHLVSPLTGVLTNLGELPDRTHPLSPIYGAGYFVAPLTASADPTESFDRMSLGKGRSHAQSRASAMCEGLERYAAVFQGDEPRLRASYAALAPAAVDPRELQNFSDAQYATRHESQDRRRMVPLPFDPRQELDWTPAWELTRGRRRYLPTSYCFTHTPTAAEERVALYNPNGHAAGNCIEEAILQGFLELVERDAAALWWYNRVARPAVDLESFGSTYFKELSELDRSRGLAMHVLDMTTDLGIPAMVSVAFEERSGRVFLGFGCHLDAELAVQRSLTELHQVFDPTGKGQAPFMRSDFADERFLWPSGALRQATDFTPPGARGLAHAVQTCVDRVARLGMDTLVVDYTRPDIGLSTVKVVVPGLRHFWPRFGPGRLYDVPVALGWLPRKLDEGELNPIPLLM